MKYDHIIWDFNGTILDDVDTGLRSVNKLLGDRGLPTLESKRSYRAVFGFPIIDYYRRLGFDFEAEPYEVIAPLWVEQYMINVKDAPVFEDVRDTIFYLDERKIPQTLLSATERNMLLCQLETLGLRDTFAEVLGRDDIHAASKGGVAQEWRDRHPGEKTLMIGDTDHDLQVARQIGADCVLVCRGHQSGEYLKSLGVPVFDSLSQLIKYMEEKKYV